MRNTFLLNYTESWFILCLNSLFWTFPKIHFNFELSFQEYSFGSNYELLTAKPSCVFFRSDHCLSKSMVLLESCFRFKPGC